jgi:hypothetical protein
MPKQKSAMLGLTAAAAVCGTSFSALAGPTVKACPTTATPLSTYLSGGVNATCTVLDKTISGVSFSNLDNFPIDRSVTVTPVLVTNNPGLTFNLGDFNSVDLSVSYTITAPASAPMTDASLMGSVSASPDGAATVAEMLSNSETLSVSTSAPSASLTFAAVTNLMVTNTTTLDNAAVNTIENQFSETPVAVPVPKLSPLASLALLGIGLSTLEAVRRRRRS